jgi:hypothetical protein
MTEHYSDENALTEPSNTAVRGFGGVAGEERAQLVRTISLNGSLILTAEGGVPGPEP